MLPFPWYYATEYIPSFWGTPLFIFGWIFHGLVVIILIFLWWQSCKKRPEYKEFDGDFVCKSNNYVIVKADSYTGDKRRINREFEVSGIKFYKLGLSLK